MKKYLKLILVMLKIGAVTFGGGYAMIAILRDEFVDRRGWLTSEDFLDIVAIAESTPGPIAVNMATYIGYTVGGVLGSVLATLALCLPAFVIIGVISLFFDAFLSLTYVAYAFRGIQVAVAFLILSAGVRTFRSLERSPLNIILFVLTVAVMLVTDFFAVGFSSILYILAGGLIGLIVRFFLSPKPKTGKGGDGK